MAEATSSQETGAKAAPNRVLDVLRQADPVLAQVIDAHPDFDPRAWLAELPPMDAFGALLFQVAGQQLSVTASRHILNRVQDEFGGLLPSPEAVLAAPPQLLQQTGLSGRKVDTIRAIAARFLDGSLSAERLGSLSDEQVEAVLTEIPGVGPWTVHGFLIIALDRPDVVLPGDLALRKVIQSTYGLPRLPSREEVLDIAEQWRPYRSVATAYLFQHAFSSKSKR